MTKILSYFHSYCLQADGQNGAKTVPNGSSGESNEFNRELCHAFFPWASFCAVEHGNVWALFMGKEKVN